MKIHTPFGRHRYWQICVVLICLSSQFLTKNIVAQAIDWDSNVPASWLKGATLSTDNPEIQGTPYLFDEWLPGSLIMTNGRFVEGIRINFVNQAGEVMVSKPYAGMEVKYGVIEKDIRSVTVAATNDQREMRFVRMWSDTIEGPGTDMRYFYEVMLEGKVTLLRKPYKGFIRARQTEAYSNGSHNAKYVMREEFYLRIPEQKGFSTVLMSKKSLLKALSKQHGNQAKALMKQNKWKWKSNEHIMLLFKKLFE